MTGVVAAATIAVSFPSTIVNADEGYTYNYDYWGDIQYSPDAYSVAGVYTSVDLGLEQKFNNPSGLYVNGNYVYICDTGNNRIVEVERTDTTHFEVTRIIDSFDGNGITDIETFSSPTDVAISEEGCIFIADKSNHRILKLDKDLKLILQFEKPDDATFSQSLDFLPDKLTIDTADRVYCAATNVNSGLIKYEADGSFAGFVGATEVTYDWTDYIWKRIATKEQRAQMESFVPTEYDNVYMDHEGFIYACTTNVSETDLDDGSAQPIRRLNMLGSDILVRNGNWEIIGDLYWGDGGGYSGPSLLTDITAFDNDVYVALDKVRGRLFGYDDQGRMLFAFGGNGNMDGYFRNPVALEHMDYDLIVLDSLDASFTVFTPTEFGGLIYEAIDEFQAGDYEASGESWQKVMDLNGNYDLAYIGIGRSLLRQEKYHEAMEYFKLKWDIDNYSKAFKQYRKEWVEEHIIIIVILFFAILIVPLIVGKIRGIKKEIDTADIFKKENGG
jgi:hypothetical protein